MRNPRTPTAAILLLAAVLALSACATVSAAPRGDEDRLPAQRPAAGAAGPQASAKPETAPAGGFFSAAQAELGATTYQQACSECHARSEFRGPEFEWRWRRQTAWELFREISTTMPEDRPGSLSEEAYVAIVAYLLSLNDYQQGGTVLEPTREALSSIALGTGAARTPAPD